MAPIGSVWGSGTWVDDAWGDGTWADVEVVIIDYSVTFTILIPPDDYSVTVPEEKTVNTAWYADVNLVDQNGDFLVDEAGNFLVINVATVENVYVIHVPQDDYSVIVPEET
jgi:hypothetical protein